MVVKKSSEGSRLLVKSGRLEDVKVFRLCGLNRLLECIDGTRLSKLDGEESEHWSESDATEFSVMR